MSLVIIALADTLSDLVSLTPLFSEKKSATLNSPRLLAERRAGDRGVRGGVFVE